MVVAPAPYWPAVFSQDSDIQVLLLEAGPATGPAAMAVPPAWLELLGSEIDWGYTTTPQRHTNGIRHFWPRGKVLGGYQQHQRHGVRAR